MKSLKQTINEKLKLADVKITKYYPKTKVELKELLKQLIEERGNEGDFNDIDTSKITDMKNLIPSRFNGDISQWNVSNVTNMESMFEECASFNGDLSKWDVSNVYNMSWMFRNCYKFDQDLSKWNVSNVTDMFCMFECCKSFNQDISNWDVSKVTSRSYIFDDCPIEEKYKPKFK